MERAGVAPRGLGRAFGDGDRTGARACACALARGCALACACACAVGGSPDRRPARRALRGDRRLRLVRRLDHVLRYGDEEALADPGGVRPRGEHGGDADDDAHQDDPAQVHLEQTRRGDRAGVRRQERVRHRQAREQRHGVEQDRLAGALGRRVHDRRQDEDAYVEEDRDAEDEAGQAHGERGALLTEQVEQAGRERLRAARHLQDRAEHRAEADDDRHVAEDSAHARLDHRDGGRPLDRAEEFGDGEAGREADGYGHRQQRDERLQSDLDDQNEEQDYAEGRDRQEAGGAVDEQEQAACVRWRFRGGCGCEQGRHGGPLLKGMELSGRGIAVRRPGVGAGP